MASASGLDHDQVNTVLVEARAEARTGPGRGRVRGLDPSSDSVLGQIQYILDPTRLPDSSRFNDLMGQTRGLPLVDVLDV